MGVVVVIAIGTVVGLVVVGVTTGTLVVMVVVGATVPVVLKKSSSFVSSTRLAL